MVLNPQTEKGMQECELIKKGIFDSLDEMVQEAERTLMDIYRFNKGKAELEFDDVRMYTHSYENAYGINISRDFELVIRPEKIVETKKVTVPRTGFLRFLGTEKNKKIKEKHEELRISIPSWSHLSKYNDERDESLVETARNIKNQESIVGADDLAYLCRRIKELPPQIITYIESTAKEVNESKIPISIKDIGLKCGYCGGPNKKLELFCEYCGHSVNEALPEKK